MNQHSPTEPAPSMGLPTSSKIISSPFALVVEDDSDARLTLMMCLQEAGYKCLGSNNGFLDLNMPVMNGWQFLSVVRLCGPLSHLPVFITTGESIPDNSAYKVLRKPYSLDRIMEVAHQYLEHTTTPPEPGPHT